MRAALNRALNVVHQSFKSRVIVACYVAGLAQVARR